MATEDEGQADEGGQGAHGPAVAGHGKHKGGGLLNGPHREMVIMVASVVGVGLAYATLHRSSSSGSSAAQTAAMSYPGSSGPLSAGQVSGFDQSAVAGLQTMLANQSDQLRNLTSSLPAGYGAGSAPHTPSPLAASLLAPSDSTTLAQYGGNVYQVQGDGSLYHLSLPEFGALGSPYSAIHNLTGSAPGPDYSYTSNLTTKINSAPGVAQP